MKRYICTLTICLILIILGLYKMGIVLFEYKGKPTGNYYATIESKPLEKQYTNMYDIKIDGKKFIIYIKKTEPNLEIGDIIRFSGKFQKPAKQRNEGGFDYSLYLKTKKIYGIFRAESIEKIGQKKSVHIQIKRAISKIQHHIKESFQKELKTENSALITALLIGDKSNVDENVINNFRDASLSHILAISGAHFSYIIILINCINKSLKHKRIGNIISIIVILFFMLLTGNTTSVTRAGIMSIMVILAELLHTKSDIWTNLAISLLIQIINNPYVIFDIGLILSYGGVIGIVTFYNLIQKKISSKTISITLSANLVIMPVMIYNYNTISLSFVISNICASIFLGPIIILGFLSVIFKFKIMFIILDILLSLLQSIVQICAKIPLSKIYIRTPSIISIVMFYLIVAYLIKGKSIKVKRISNKLSNIQESRNNHKITLTSKHKVISILIIIMLMSNLNLQALAIRVNGNLLINFVDVGQGDSTLIRVNNKTIMIDSGGTTDTSAGYDLGKNTILPYLLDKKITKLDYIMVSHFDADHSQGFMYVLNNMKIENAIICKQAKNSQLYQEFLKICKKKKIKIIYVKNGDNIKIGKVLLKVLHPQRELITNNPLNNNAIVVKLIYNKFTMLFTGDIEKEAEELIMKSDINLKADILKVGHHGSKTSTTQSFLEKISPKIALIGVGENNKFGHPNEDVLNRLQALGTQIYRTDNDGEITIKVNKKGKVVKISKHIK